MKHFLLVVWCLFAANYSYAEEILPFKDDAQRQLYQQLTAELRCPQCQNQNVADSNAVVAVDMREKTYQLIQEGKSRQQILDYMVNRYGDFAHYQPPINKLTLWLWIAPLAMLVGLLLVGAYKRKTSSAQQTDDKAMTADTAMDNTQADHQQSAELDKLIDRYRSKK